MSLSGVAYISEAVRHLKVNLSGNVVIRLLFVCSIRRSRWSTGEHGGEQLVIHDLTGSSPS